METQKIWADILSNIKQQVSSSVFKTWFLGSKALELKQNNEGNLLVVGVSNNFLKENLEKRFSETISTIGKKHFKSNFEVIFVVNSSSEKVNKEPIFSGVVQNVILKRRSEILNPSYTFNNMVMGPSNNLAYLASKSVSASIGSGYNPLFIYGPTGVGKTHLLHAIGNEFLQNTQDGKALYVSSERFTNDYLESLVNKTQIAFRSKYRRLDLLLIDDVQFLAGKESTQDEFFHTFNELVLSGSQVVLVCDRHPKELGQIKERLVSRFLGGLSVDMNFPDLEMKIAILKLKCKEKGVTIEDETINYIAESCSGGARELEGSLINVLSMIKFGGIKISASNLKDIAINPLSKTKVNKEEILDGVCSFYRLKKGDIVSKSRRAKYNLARQVTMYFLRREADLSLSEIGQMFFRDHSTVIHAVEKVSTMAQNQKFNDELLRIRKVFSN